jgi:hypothetical protein
VNTTLIRAPDRIQGFVIVPEPATLGLMVLDLLGGAGFARRKRKS